MTGTGTVFLDGEVMTFGALERRVGPTKAGRVSSLYCHRDWPGGRAEGLPRAAAIAIRDQVGAWVASGCVGLDAPAVPRSGSRRALNRSERAELELLRDLRQVVLGFGGDDYTIMPWIDRHRLHGEEPYIGCPFCRPAFGLRTEVIQDVLATIGEYGGGSGVHADAARHERGRLVAYLAERYGVEVPS